MFDSLDLRKRSLPQRAGSQNQITLKPPPFVLLAATTTECCTFQLKNDPRTAMMARMAPTPHAGTAGAFAGIQDCIAKFEQLALAPIEATGWNEQCHSALNGEAAQALRRIAPLGVRRKFGAFFTGVDLSDRLLACSSPPGSTSFFYDATCGMGDLLLAAAKRLPVCKTLNRTLWFWGKHLAGTDLHSEFIEGAKIRLVLLARQRLGGEIPDIDATKYFPHIRVGDGFAEHTLFARTTHVLLNPPYGKVPAPADCPWSGGQITEAAMFTMAALERVAVGTEILAVLPDVLRSGSFCSEWRDAVSDLAEIHLVETYGIFDEHADVDVFLLRLVRRRKNGSTQEKRWPSPNQSAPVTVGDKFEIKVGRVVPYRDAQEGPSYPYLHPRGVPAWTTMSKFPETRKFRGNVFTPPFVVIRRTSRPGHPHRAIATVITGKSAVAVENHLIVCTPKEGGLETCQGLMAQLKTEAVNTFLDKQIRCRHLTVPAVREVPWVST